MRRVAQSARRGALGAGLHSAGRHGGKSACAGALGRRQRHSLESVRVREETEVGDGTSSSGRRQRVSEFLGQRRAPECLGQKRALGSRERERLCELRKRKVRSLGKWWWWGKELLLPKGCGMMLTLRASWCCCWSEANARTCGDPGLDQRGRAGGGGRADAAQARGRATQTRCRCGGCALAEA